MRHSNHAGRGRRLPIWAAGLLVMIVAACGSSAAPPSAAPTPAPTPSPTPDPHLTAPVKADAIYTALAKGGLAITPINANLGQGNPDIVKEINANLKGWPIRITEYRSTDALVKALGWTPGEPPGGDEAPYAFAALNLLVTYGPISARAPSVPETGRQQDAASIVAVLDPLLWPIAQRSVMAIPSRTPIPAATPVPSVKPTPTAKATPAATPRPSAKATPKPTKKP
jgi:hypothetical protein